MNRIAAGAGSSGRVERSVTVIAALAVCALWSAASLAREGFPPAAPAVAIEHVTVLPMTANGAPLSDMTVVVRDGLIASIASSKSAGRVRGVKRINGAGKWLMPGFTDMHMHFENEAYRRHPAPTAEAPRDARRRGPDTPYLRSDDVFTPFLANGVLQVVELQATSASVGMRIEVESGRVLGPHIWLAAMIDGSPPNWPIGSTRVAVTPDNGRQAVRDAAAEGYDFIKPYGSLDLDTFTAIVDEARKLNMRVMGHIPQRGKGLTDKFFQPGFDMVAHAEEFAQQTTPPAVASIPQYVEMMKRHGAWLTATLTVDERILEQLRDPKSLNNRPELRYLSPGRHQSFFHENRYIARSGPAFIKYLSDIVEFNGQLVRAFVAAGVPIVAGTDAGIPGIASGFSLHDELDALSRAGLTNQQVMESATRLPSEWLGVAEDRGTVEVGKSADLLLLDANPLEDVRNARRISGVILRGHYLPRPMLDRRLAEMEGRYKTMIEDMAEASKKAR